jgi:L-fucose mutarotase/ribose pyranase (RbsD/FucU family)
MTKPYFSLTGLVGAILLAAIPATAQSWQSRVADELPLMGHRNWILIVDSAYPEQVGAGIETIDTKADQLDVVRAVLMAIDNSVHTRPVIFMDAELPFVPDQEAPGVAQYREQIRTLLHDYEVHSRLHQSLIDEIAKDSAQYHVLILKTHLTLPYTSVFVHLDCKYWSTDNERNLREMMGAPTRPRRNP